ncbi:MAG TPA: type II secretion system inner membrane protein GspF [Alcaligenaceae bacterium]|nr:type II secretion system inner membrane protein GspF [Alcaligenaceae bacterium]
MTQRFYYHALDAQGKKHKGLIEAESIDTAHLQLQQQGLLPLRLTISHRLFHFKPHKKIKDKDLGWMTRQLASLLSAQLPLEAALTAVIEQSEQKNIRDVLTTIRGEVRAGHRFGEALAQFPQVFPVIYCALVDAGEQSGELDQILTRLADYIEQRNALRNKLLSAFIYPIIVSVVSVAIIIFLLSYVVPQVVGAFTQTKQSLPPLTLVMLWVSDLIQQWGWLIGLLAVLGVIVGRIALQQPSLRLAWDKKCLQAPLLGQYLQGLDVARFASTLAILTNSSVPLLQALDAANKTIQNTYLRQAVNEATLLVREGSSLGAALHKQRCFPPLLIHLTQSGERTGQLPKMLDHAAQSFSSELEQRAITTTALLEPLMILGMGGMVLLIVLAVMLPIIQLNQLIQ